MGKLRKASHWDVPVVSSLDSADSGGEPFVPNDFAEDGSYPVSMVFYLFCASFYFSFIAPHFLGLSYFLYWLLLQELSDDEGGLDKALLKFYLNQVCFILSRTFHSCLIFFIFFFSLK